ncbi:unnamed protein product [Paramecium pentaurelia]|uniref:Uncharacterized protein n=1 Tax=Paramecium pentaurelia TaxID=43138 RepID=A0A8S1WV70_9CILI|nr:unnamed protein product [Paramecium pentaurelia]
MGYIQVLTFDFRKFTAASEPKKYIKKSVETFYRLTRKRTYSLGSFSFLLHKQCTQWLKQKNIKVVGIVTIAEPLLGAIKKFNPQVSGADSFISKVLILDADINWYTQKKMAHIYASILVKYLIITAITFIIK